MPDLSWRIVSWRILAAPWHTVTTAGADGSAATIAPRRVAYAAPMLFTRALWPGLADGSVTVAFRRWRRATVRAGGTLQTAAGVLAIDRVDIIAVEDITEADAVRAGYGSVSEVLDTLRDGPGRDLYRIEFHHAGADPRRALRADTALDDGDLAALRARLARLDARSSDGPWTLRVLDLIAAHPALRAADLAQRSGQETLRFKRRVRRLKELGLTESLEVGYRLSPRGRAALDRLR
jgi:hypothetical protein